MSARPKSRRQGRPGPNADDEDKDKDFQMLLHPPQTPAGNPVKAP